MPWSCMYGSTCSMHGCCKAGASLRISVRTMQACCAPEDKAHSTLYGAKHCEDGARKHWLGFECEE